MTIRKTTINDLPAVTRIFESARLYMAENGNPHQWVNRPTAEDVMKDLQSGCSYVCLEQEEIVGTFAYLPGPDPTYAIVYDGAWPDNEPYGVIHRLAGSAGHHGIAEAAFQFAFTQCERLRIDTHKDNHILQNLLKRHQFTFCGTILLENGDPRWAYFKHQPKH